MCLHPQLQYQMARLIIRMVNSGINIVASTHSDIIIQHINNMCQLNGHYDENRAILNQMVLWNFSGEKDTIFRSLVSKHKKSARKIQFSL